MEDTEKSIMQGDWEEQDKWVKKTVKNTMRMVEKISVAKIGVPPWRDEKTENALKMMLVSKGHQLINKRERLYNYSHIIKRPGHVYSTWNDEGLHSKDNAPYCYKYKEDEDALTFYCMFKACIQPWQEQQKSTDETIKAVLGVIEHLLASDPIKTWKFIEKAYEKVELPFQPSKEYGRYSLKYPVIGPDARIDDDNRAFALFLMLFFELHGSMRLRYARECERIRSSAHFRYAQYKSQVMINCASDEQRTRLVHSLEVAGIARTCAAQLGCNWELVEAIALGHDLGHVPFGHNGEDQLDACLHEAWAGRFSHALQSVKVLNCLETHTALYEHYGLRGLCLSRPVLEGVLKHDTDILFQDICRAGFRLQYDGWRDFLAKDEWNNGLKLGTLESQIVYWADKIAYAGHDWEEVVGLGILYEMMNQLDGMFNRMRKIKHMILEPKLKKAVKPYTEDDVDKLEDNNLYELYKTHESKLDNREKLTLEEKLIWEAHALIAEMSDTLSGKGKDEEKTDEEKIVKAFHPEDSAQMKALPPDAPNEKKQDAHKDASPLHNLVDLLCGKQCDIGYEKIAKEGGLSYFLESQYKMMLDFFDVAKAWITITGVYPKQYKKSNDVLFILCRYLESINNRSVVRAMEYHLIEHSRKKIAKLKTQTMEMYVPPKLNGGLLAIRKRVSDIGYLVNDEPENLHEKIKGLDKSFRDKLQKKMMPISLGNSVLGEHHAYPDTRDFIGNYYRGNPRVRIMKKKASMIIKKLFDFFMANEEMLPAEYQNRIGVEQHVLAKTRWRDDKRFDEKKMCSADIEGSLVRRYLYERWIEHKIQGIKIRKEAELEDFIEQVKQERKAIEPKTQLNFYRLAESFNEPNDEKPLMIDPGVLKCLKDYVKSGAENNESDKMAAYNALCRHITKARVIADYIASMTDRMAEKKFNEIISSNTAWSDSYHE